MIGRRLGATLLTLLALALLGAGAAGAQPAGGGDAGEKKKPRKPFAPSALFADDSVIAVTLVADFGAVFADRDTLNPKRHPGELRVAGGKHGTKTLPVALHTRGHFRLRRDQCNFPPLRVLFDKNTKNTPFDDQDGLKLVTHCSNGSREHEQYVLRELLAYRAHALVTPGSFRARLARVRYVPAKDTAKAFERWGFFLESEKELARRLGGRIMPARNARYHDLPDSAVALSLWEYFLGNTDWSLSALHNVRLVQLGQGAGDVIGVPYDFDHSGWADTRYATVDARLGIRTVRERLWRGPCPSVEAVRAAAAPYLAQRAALEALPRSLPGVENGWAEQTERFVKAFFDELRDPVRFAARARAARPGCPVSN